MAAKKKIKCTPGCPNKFDETCCRSRGESPDVVPVPVPLSAEAVKSMGGLSLEVATGKGLDQLAYLYGIDHERKVTAYLGLFAADAPCFGPDSPSTVGRILGEVTDKLITSGTMTISCPETIKKVVAAENPVEVSIGYVCDLESLTNPLVGADPNHSFVIEPKMRRCNRQGCRNPAVRAEGHTRWSRLCKDHNRSRSSAIEASHLKERCGCGNIAPKGKSICSRCYHIERTGRIAERGDGWEVDELMRDVEELFRGIFAQSLSYLPAMKDMKHIMARIDSFRTNIPQSAKTHKAVLRLRELAMQHADPELESIADELEVVKVEDGPERDLQ